MEVVFFTEMGFKGKIPRTHPNMRTEFAWMVAMNADHYNIREQVLPKKYDLGIIIIPKKNPKLDLTNISKFCDKVAVMQEGPHWYFQDYPVHQQIEYYNTLTEADIILVHNQADKIYYEGLTNHKDVRVLRTLMIEEPIGELQSKKREGVIIGGNFVHWYGGFDSYIVAREVTDEVWAPSMGRKQENEQALIKHLPYMQWNEWIHKLNEFKIGVHLMRTHAAGTFALNCAFLGIPCIGYRGLDTQEICFPETTVSIGDLGKAKELINKLENNKEFYNLVSKIAKENYKKHYQEDKFKF